MKKQVKVIRSAHQTVVIYRDAPKQRTTAVIKVAPANPVPVYVMGVLTYVIMPSGRMYTVPRTWLQFFINLITKFTFA